MARIAMFPAALSMTTDLTGDTPQSNGRLPGSYAYTLAHAPSDTIAQSASQLFAPGGAKSFYFRMYVRIREYPGSGGLRIFGGTNTIEGGELAWFFRLMTDGTVNGYSRGSAGALLVADGVKILALDTWYRLSGQVIFRGPSGASGANLLRLSIDGVLDSTGSTSAQNTGINQTTAVGATLQAGTSVINGDADGGQVEICDYVADDTTEPGAGGVSLLHVTANGTYTDWTGSWRHVTRRHPNGGVTAPSSVPSLNSSTVDARSTFTVESLASRGLSGVTIKSHWVVAFGTTVRANNQYVLRINGVDNLSPTFAAASAVYQGASLSGRSSSIRGWWQDVSSLALSPSDTVEIGFEDGPSGGGTAYITGLYFIVDWEGSDPTPTVETDTDIKIEYGSYIGNAAAAGRHVDFTDLTLDPTYLLIIGDDTGALQRVHWARGFGEFGDNSIAIATQNILDHGLSKISVGGFEVIGGNGTLNENNIVFRYLAIQDKTRRFSVSGVRGLSTATAVDDIDVPIDDAELYLSTLTTYPTFKNDALLTACPRPGALATANKNWFRTSDYVGDSSSSLSSTDAETTDGIQDLATGSFQLGTKPVSTASKGCTCWASFSTLASIFYQTRLAEVGKWVGDGLGSRVIPFASVTDPSFILVVPESATARFYRFFNDGNGTTSRILVTGVTSTTGITAFETPGEVTVNTALNTSGTTYHYLVFGVGVDNNDLFIIVPQPSPDIALCVDCKCRIDIVPNEIRVAMVPAYGDSISSRTALVSPEVRDAMVVAEIRDMIISSENRTLNIPCA